MPVDALGNDAGAPDARDLKILELEAERNGLTNLLTALVRGTGGSAFVSSADLAAVRGCVLTSAVDRVALGVRLSVRRESDPDAPEPEGFKSGLILPPGLG